MSVIKGEREGRHALTRWVGRGSSWQVDNLDLRMRFDISATVGRSKLDSGKERGAYGVE